MPSLRRTRGDEIFDVLNTTLMMLVLLVVIYPLYFVVIASFSSPEQVNAGRVWLLPRGITLEGYSRIFQDQTIWRGYRNTITYTVLGRVVNMVLTIPETYSLSRKDFVVINSLTLLFAFTTFFAGGLIPRYLLVRSLGMVNTIWAMVIPNAVLVWNVVVARTFFQHNIPRELLEAAVMDGCGNSRFFVSIVLPLSRAILAVMVLFYAVGHWNSFFPALIYLRDAEMYPLQIVLRDILIQAEVQSQMMEDATAIEEQQRLGELIKYGAIIVASVPVLMLYPFLQKYFVRGIMIGAIKG